MNDKSTMDELFSTGFLDVGSEDAFDPFAGATDFMDLATDDIAEQDMKMEEISEKVMPFSVAEAKTENISAVEFNPLVEAINIAEEKTIKTSAASVFSKPAVFFYGGAKEPIEDATLTFEQVRIAKSEDFPELEDVKKVTWSMEYGKITKQVPKPKETVIQKLKEEVESSKEFLEALKQSKDKEKDFICKVKPRITAQSKGENSSYKGVFITLEQAEQSDKAISIVPSQDGKVYEIRCTEAGRFTVPIRQIKELSDISAGFIPALPLIPFSIIGEIIGFFRYFMKKNELEALVHIYWDRKEQKYRVFVPKQKVTKASVDATLCEELDSERYLHFADIHSHNSMEARFSVLDDRDEKATRVYIVIGCLHEYFPQISARISCGGKYHPIDFSTIVENIPSNFPEKWLKYVDDYQQNTSKIKETLGWEG